jgi:hypothetical protein
MLWLLTIAINANDSLPSSLPTEIIRGDEWHKILDDPPLAQFRLERLEDRLERMRANPDFGDERAQDRVLSEIRRLRIVLNLPDIYTQKLDAPTRPPEKAPPNVPPAIEAAPAISSFSFLPLIGAVAVSGSCFLFCIKRRTRKKGRLPVALLPRLD